MPCLRPRPCVAPGARWCRWTSPSRARPAASWPLRGLQQAPGVGSAPALLRSRLGDPALAPDTPLAHRRWSGALLLSALGRWGVNLGAPPGVASPEPWDRKPLASAGRRWGPETWSAWSRSHSHVAAGGRPAAPPPLPPPAPLSAAGRRAPRPRLSYRIRPVPDPGAQPLLPLTPSESCIPSEL